MKKKRILIIGKRSFIGSNLYFFLKNKEKVNICDFVQAKKKNLKKYDYLINCTSNKKYINNKYSIQNDFDLNLSKKIEKSNTKYIFLSSRKVYKPEPNITEKSQLSPRNNYAKNKLITEKKILNILSKRAIILRISNLIGNKIKLTKKKLHFTYIDHFYKNLNNKIIIINKKIYKDFLPISIFCKIIHKIIKKDIYGIYNVSMGKKVFLDKLNQWLITKKKNANHKVKILNKQNKTDSFYLNNKKLIKKLKINFNLNDLKKECRKVSKNHYKW